MGWLLCSETTRGRMFKLASVVKKKQKTRNRIKPTRFLYCLKSCQISGALLNVKNVLDLAAIIKELLTFSVILEARPPNLSFLVLRRTRDWSPLTFNHFLLINWVQHSHLFPDRSSQSFSLGSQRLLGALKVSASLSLTAVAVCYNKAVRAFSGGLLI